MLPTGLRLQPSRAWLMMLLALLFSSIPLGRAQTNCFNTINNIALNEAFLSATELLQKRTYNLCPGSNFTIGKLDFDYNLAGGQDMIPLRPNLHIKCGADGSRLNGCLVQGGTIQVDGTDNYGISQPRLDNVVLEGITFSDTRQHSAWFNKPGNVLFKDCEFRDNTKALTPVLADYYSADNRQTELSVTFLECAFDNNRYFGGPAQPALVVGNGLQNRLIFEVTTFTNNDMIFNNTQVSSWRSSNFAGCPNGFLSPPPLSSTNEITGCYQQLFGGNKWSFDHD